MAARKNFESITGIGGAKMAVSFAWSGDGKAATSRKQLEITERGSSVSAKQNNRILQ